MWLVSEYSCAFVPGLAGTDERVVAFLLHDTGFEEAPFTGRSFLGRQFVAGEGGFSCFLPLEPKLGTLTALILAVLSLFRRFRPVRLHSLDVLVGSSLDVVLLIGLEEGQARVAALGGSEL